MKNSRKPLIIVSMALLLAVVLAMGGVTFAKYISTTNTDTNEARVAKWGFTLEYEAATMFGPEYDWNDSSSAVVDEEDGTLVVAVDAANLVAPGTSGSMSFTIGGTAEVWSQFYVTVLGQEVSLEGGDLADTYYPMDWTLEHDGTKLVTDGRLADVLDAIKDLDLVTVDANDDTADILGTYTISWKWDFEQGDEADLSEHIDTFANDKYDTILGQIAANNTQVPDVADGQDEWDANLNVDLYIGITVAQIQEEVTTPTADPTYPVAP